jgi:serine/threonine-protein kinase
MEMGGPGCGLRARLPTARCLLASGGPAVAEPLLRVGRYALFGELAAGGMATVHFGRLVGPVGFSRTVAIKRLHPNFAKDVEFVSMFVDEARLAARIQHPNVVPTIDVLQTDDELFLVMEYVPGESLDQLLTLARKQVKPVPLNIAAGIGCGMLHGLHAAHEAKSDSGEPLSLVHRDVSPHNVLVGVDGVPRLLDFGVAKATGRLQVTAEGQVKGKLSYMAPEQLGGDEVTREADLYAAGVVLWEILAGRRLFQAGSDVLLFAKVLGGAQQAPSSYRFEVSEQLDRVVMQALSREPSERFTTAREFALAIEECCPVASAVKIGHWVESLARDSLDARAALIADVEGAHSAPDGETRDSVESMVEATSAVPARHRDLRPRTVP